ncbi:MAG: hypothetical protein JXA71_13450 [Chitinispirillaceae bacterium]|nr:hypothetical protein [Chitinispirillaceae bacterium]
MRNVFPIILLPLLMFASGVSGPMTETARIVTVVASGESHAMLMPCDCPEGPGGGFAERATVLKNVAVTGELLLLDAGGFAGGGIYDFYTAGRAADSQRTITAIKAMAAMRYDAAAVGDEELQYGARWLARVAESAGLPLVSVNCFLKGKQRFVPSSIVVVRNGIRFGITGCTSPDRLFPIDDSCVVEDPFTALRRVWKELTAASDCQIILSHLGEEAVPAMVDSFPEVDIIVSGHRKSSHDPVRYLGRTAVMQFGYEGKSLSLVQITVTQDRKTGPSFRKGEWLPVLRGTKPEASVASLLGAAPVANGRTVYDLYIMSQCDWGNKALAELLVFTGRVPDAQWRIWFIGEKQGDSLISLHGRQEMRDEMTWLAVEARYPGKWPAFLALRSAPDATTGSVVTALGLDTLTLQRWVAQNGRSVLADHYQRSMRLSVTASPTLHINNTLFDKPVESRRLLKTHCGSMHAPPSWCDSLPSCFDDGDCRKKGHIGTCGKDGACTFVPDQPFVFRVVIADSTFRRPEQAVIATTEELFPAVSVTIISGNSPEGRKIMKRYSPNELPFYFFGSQIRKAHRFSHIESGLKQIADGFTFKKGVSSCNYFPKRELKTGSVALFVDPVFPEAMKAVARFLNDSLPGKTIRLVPVVYEDPALPSRGLDEKIRREEALRWLIVDSLHRADFRRYVERYAQDPGSSQHWLAALGDIGIDHAAFTRLLKAHEGMLAFHWKRIGGLSLKDPIALLVDNRELVPLHNQAELTEMLLRLKQR